MKYVTNVKKKFVPDQKKKAFSQHLRTMIVDCVRNDKIALNLCMISNTFMEQLYVGDSLLMLWIAMVDAVKYNKRRYKRLTLSFIPADMKLPKEISNDTKEEIGGDFNVGACVHAAVLTMIDESTAAVKTIDDLIDSNCIAIESQSTIFQRSVNVPTECEDDISSSNDTELRSVYFTTSCRVKTLAKVGLAAVDDNVADKSEFTLQLQANRKGEIGGDISDVVTPVVSRLIASVIDKIPRELERINKAALKFETDQVLVQAIIDVTTNSCIDMLQRKVISNCCDSPVISDKLKTLAPLVIVTICFVVTLLDLAVVIICLMIVCIDRATAIVSSKVQFYPNSNHDEIGGDMKERYSDKRNIGMISVISCVLNSEDQSSLCCQGQRAEQLHVVREVCSTDEGFVGGIVELINVIVSEYIVSSALASLIVMSEWLKVLNYNAKIDEVSVFSEVDLDYGEIKDESISCSSSMYGYADPASALKNTAVKVDQEIIWDERSQGKVRNDLDGREANGVMIDTGQLITGENGYVRVSISRDLDFIAASSIALVSLVPIVDCVHSSEIVFGDESMVLIAIVHKQCNQNEYFLSIYFLIIVNILMVYDSAHYDL